MEALLPSLISKESPVGYKGTAMGIYSTSQFIGVAIGGSLGGFLYAHDGAATVLPAAQYLRLFGLPLASRCKNRLMSAAFALLFQQEFRPHHS